MLEPIITFFDKLVDQFSWRRLLFIIAVIVIAVVCLLIFEGYTGHFRFGRLQNATELLDKLIAQEKTLPNEANSPVTKIHQGLLRDFDSYVNSPKGSDFYFKAFCAAVPWLLLSFLIFLSTNKMERNTILGMVIITLPLALIGGFIPTFDRFWINYFGYPALSFLIPFFFLWKYGTRTNKTEEAQQTDGPNPSP